MARSLQPSPRPELVPLPPVDDDDESVSIGPMPLEWRSFGPRPISRALRAFEHQRVPRQPRARRSRFG